MKTFFSMMLFGLLSAFSYGQLAVENDPFHKVVFENEKVRVLDLSISGTDTTTLHVHKAASLVVFVTQSKLAIQSPGEAAVITNVDAGTTVYRAYDKTPTIHRVWSADGSPMRCIVVETKE